MPSDAPYPAGLKGANSNKNEDNNSNQIKDAKLEEALSEAEHPKEDNPTKEEAPKEKNSAKVEAAIEEAPKDSDQLEKDANKEKEN